jgi:hypothetical protein
MMAWDMEGSRHTPDGVRISPEDKIKKARLKVSDLNYSIKLLGAHMVEKSEEP